MTSTEPEAIDPVADDRPEPLDPESRARPGISGAAVVLADGRTWLLADGIPDLTRAVWSSLFDDNLLRGTYEWSEIALASAYLLMANYRLDIEEAHALICGSHLPPLVPAVERALFGVESEGTFGTWAITSLWANGIDPDRLPPRLLWPVLGQLVRLGRAEPPAAAIRSVREAGKDAQWDALLRARGLRTGPGPSSPGT